MKKIFFVGTLLCFFLSPSKLQAQANQNVVNGSNTTPVVFSTLGCKYTWTNTDPSIGLPVSGTGDIAPFKAINNGTVPITATITATTTPIAAVSYLSNTFASPPDFTTADPTTLQKQTPIAINGATFAGVSPDGNTLYFVKNTAPISIIEVSAITNNVIATIPVNNRILGGLLFSSDGSKIYVPNLSSPTTAVMSVINSSTNTIESTINLPTNGFNAIILSPDGSKFYVLIADNAIAVYSTTTNVFVSNLPLPETRPVNMFLTPDGNYLLVLFNSNAVYIIDTKTGNAVPVTIPGFASGSGYSFPSVLISPDSKQAYLTYSPIPFLNSGAKNYLFAVDIPSGAVSSVQTTANNFGVTLSPDGKQLAILDGAGGMITLMDAATRIVTTTIKVDPTITAVLFEEIDKSARLSYNYDGSLMYVDYDAFNKVSLGFSSYVTLINTATGKIIDPSIEVTKGDRIINPKPPTACSGAPIRFNITVYPDAPIINATGTLPAMSTNYGTPSTSASFTVSGSKINIGILVTPPSGFEVSTDNVAFGDSVKVGPSPTVPSTQVYVRLKANAPVGIHSGDIIVSNGPTSVTIATAASEVTAVPLTITANDVTKTYGAVLNTALASTAFTATGLKNGEAIGSVVLTYGTGSAATDGVNSYTGSVTPSSATGGTFSATNYTISYQAGNIIITPAPLTITANNQTRYFHDANPVFTVTYTGFVNKETAAVLTSQPVITIRASLTSPIGQYPITASGASAVNYSIIYVAGTLTIMAKPVIVTNIFTPNGDGINDTWDIKNINEYPGCMVEIFNRYGEKMFYSIGYGIPWEGKRNGANLPVGTYYYIIKLDTGIKPLTGYLAIIR
ncbi:MAG: MBG domain-containing protein [Bacteroidota bacterium]